MFPNCVLAGSIARRAAMRLLLNSNHLAKLSSSRHILPASFAKFGQFQQNCGQRTIATGSCSKEQPWSPEDLKEQPEEPKPEVHPLDAEKWTPVHKFRYIKELRLCVRLKLYQTAFCLFSTAALPVASYFGVEVPQETAMLMHVFNLYTLLAMLGIGHYAQKVIGILYINESRDKVRIANLSFYGHRVDTMIDIQDIMHVSDMEGWDRAPYIRLKRYSKPKEDLLVYLGNGVLDRELFAEIFGKVPQLDPKRRTRFGAKKDQ